MPDNRNALVNDIRRFNRFYTSRIGLLDETLTQSAYTLAEARVLFELGQRPGHIASDPGGMAGFLARALNLDFEPAASEIAGQLQMDPGHVLRILRKLCAAGLVEMRRCSAPPLSRRILSLTARGQAALAALHAAADRDLARVTDGLGDKEAAELSGLLARVRSLLDEAAASERLL
ncbi:MAG: winged helix-turn-helix transcriptional regulator [Mesorhizobium sp.]|uniref:MarR family winged helix-turn-helix transcriptional regulator n=1 Tax=Mesorhizobium sp. TaxID=1871066 RepID=UPI001AC7D2E9|nr:MarR family winged helix-turn-helix transcriptional regulator [Mesorhizobium sp.]MBN9218869.1 winged helix-turn-helix transcriptional regulator [Mesorhizobium sp.]